MIQPDAQTINVLFENMNQDDRLLLPDEDVVLPERILQKMKIISDTLEVNAPSTEDSCFASTRDEAIIDKGAGVRISKRSASRTFSYKSVHEAVVLANNTVRRISKLIDSKPQLDGVTMAAEAFKNDEINLCLSYLPIETVNRRKLGIRISALRNAGYSNVGQLSRASYSSLMGIRGVGEKSAQLILQEYQAIKFEVESRIELNPLKRPSEYAHKMVLEYYKYYHLQKLKDKIIKKHSSTVCKIKEELKIAKPGRNWLRWFFTFNSAKKSLAYEAASRLNVMLTSDLLCEIDAHYTRQDKINAATSAEAWSDYLHMQKHYDDALSTLCRNVKSR